MAFQLKIARKPSCKSSRLLAVFLTPVSQDRSVYYDPYCMFDYEEDDNGDDADDDGADEFDRDGE